MVTGTLLAQRQCEDPENMSSSHLLLFLVDFQFLCACTQYFTTLIYFSYHSHNSETHVGLCLYLLTFSLDKVVSSSTHSRDEAMVLACWFIDL